MEEIQAWIRWTFVLSISAVKYTVCEWEIKTSPSRTACTWARGTPACLLGSPYSARVDVPCGFHCSKPGDQGWLLPLVTKDCERSQGRTCQAQGTYVA